MAEQETVYSYKLAFSKLSKLQLMILQELGKQPNGDLLAILSHTLAESYPQKSRHYTRCADNGSHILTECWKALFYRSIRRLVKRGLVERGHFSFYNEIDRYWTSPKTITLTLAGKEFLKAKEGS